MVGATWHGSFTIFSLFHKCVYKSVNNWSYSNNALWIWNNSSKWITFSISFMKKQFKACVCYFLFFHQMITFEKLWKMLFILSKKLFSFLRYSDFCEFFLSFPDFLIQKNKWRWDNLWCPWMKVG